ncbi:hypothetical protein AAG906_026254 [Vitis piasezkii]
MVYPILLDVSHYYILHVGQPDFGRPPAPLATQHLEHDAVDDLPSEHLDQELQDEALLDEGLPTDLLGSLHGRLSCPSSGDIYSRPGDLGDDVTSYLL